MGLILVSFLLGNILVRPCFEKSLNPVSSSIFKSNSTSFSNSSFNFLDLYVDYVNFAFVTEVNNLDKKILNIFFRKYRYCWHIFQIFVAKRISKNLFLEMENGMKSLYRGNISLLRYCQTMVWAMVGLSYTSYLAI